MDGYKPTSISISPSSAYVSLPLEADLADTSSLLSPFFLPEWVAKATETIKAQLRESTDARNGRLELDFDQPDREARTVVGQDGSGKFLKFWLSVSEAAADNRKRIAVNVEVERDDAGNAMVTPYAALSLSSQRYNIATKVFCESLKLSYHKVSLFFNGPNGGFLPMLLTLVIYGNGRYDGCRYRLNSSPLKGYPRGLSEHEKYIVKLLPDAPTIRAVKLCMSASKGKSNRSLARVVGWPKDSLEQATIKTLNEYEKEMRCLHFDIESLPNWKDRYYWTIPLLFCLSAPSRDLLDAIGKVLCACVDLKKRIEHIQHREILTHVIFEGGEKWPYAETLRWFQEEKERLVGKWPYGTMVEIIKLSLILGLINSGDVCDTATVRNTKRIMTKRVAWCSKRRQ